MSPSYCIPAAKDIKPALLTHWWINIPDEAKDFSSMRLIEIQKMYFELLEQFFSRPYAEMKKHNLDPYVVAASIASQEETVDALISEKHEFAELIKGFWLDHAPDIYTSLRNMSCLKVFFGGDISPSYTHNIASSVGLYMDTIVMPDPLLRATQFLETMKPQNAVFFIVKHALNILRYKELALAGVDPPIVVIVPDLSILHTNLFEQLQNVSEADTLIHCSKLFNTELSSIDELNSFLDEIQTPELLEARIFDPDRLLFDVDWTGSIPEQIDRAIDENYDLFRNSIDLKKIPSIILSTAFGRMMQINDLLFQSSQVGGSPMIDAPTSWQYLLWKYEYDAERSKEDHPSIRGSLISMALQARDSAEFNLISNIPDQALIELRANGALKELRNVIGEGLETVDAADPANLTEISDVVLGNINRVLTAHQDELAILSTERLRLFGYDVVPFITVASLMIAAPFVGNATLAAAAGLLGMAAGVKPSLEIVKDGKELLVRGHELKRSPAGILFKHIK